MHEEWVTVASFAMLAHAESCKEALANAGIEAVLQNAHFASLAWSYSNISGGIQLQVPASQLVEAEALLASIEEAAAQESAPVPTHRFPRDELAFRALRLSLLGCFLPFWPAFSSLRAIAAYVGQRGPTHWSAACAAAMGFVFNLFTVAATVLLLMSLVR